MAQSVPTPSHPNTFGLGRNPPFWTHMRYFDEMARRQEAFVELFPRESYQVNPFTRKTLDFVTGKVGEKPRVKCVQNIPGYCRLKKLYYANIIPPMGKGRCYPETSSQGYGWFPPTNEDNHDDRFTYTHKTAEFVKVAAMIQTYDKMMGKPKPISKKT